MNESLDLRNRINKMRSINNLEINENKFLKHLKMEPKKTDEKEIKKINDIKREFILPEEKISNTNSLLKKKQTNENQNFNNDIEAQFRLLANKFNESVEVILELSEKVNKLEKLIFAEKENKSYKGLPFNLRLISIIFTVFILAYSFSLIDIDSTLIREIIKEILTGI